MLSSIHPLGERARHNRWGVTAAAFTVGALASGAAAGLALGVIGWLTLTPGSSIALAATAAIALAAGVLDLSGIKPPGPARQVNENWIGTFRGWVYGGGFGLQLGAGIATYVVTWTVYAMFLSALLTASPGAGALVGATFGLGRSLSILSARFVDRPSRLTLFNRVLARSGPVVRLASPAVIIAGGLIVVGGLL
jgi:sulfite exporter TauE/SafE